jgi:hypothetical protein
MKTTCTTYHLSSAQDITIDILEAIKANFKSKPIVITVEEEIDSTAYLNSSVANKEMLQQSIEQDKKGEHTTVKL